MKKVDLNVNGCAVQVIVDAELVLLDLLRDYRRRSVSGPFQARRNDAGRGSSPGECR